MKLVHTTHIYKHRSHTHTNTSKARVCMFVWGCFVLFCFVSKLNPTQGTVLPFLVFITGPWRLSKKHLFKGSYFQRLFSSQEKKKSDT